MIAIAIAAGFLIWYIAIRDTGGTGAPTGTTITAGGAPVKASVGDLVALAEKLGHPLYWVGPQAGTRLELTRRQGDDVYVRYLTGDSRIGDPRAAFLSVGSYQVNGAYGVIQRLGRRAGRTTLKIPGGGLAVVNRRDPTNVYIAYPGQNVEVEVYDPNPKRAIELATSGAISAIG